MQILLATEVVWLVRGGAGVLTCSFNACRIRLMKSRPCPGSKEAVLVVGWTGGIKLAGLVGGRPVFGMAWFAWFPWVGFLVRLNQLDPNFGSGGCVLMPEWVWGRGVDPSPAPDFFTWVVSPRVPELVWDLGFNPYPAPDFSQWVLIPVPEWVWGWGLSPFPAPDFCRGGV